MITKSFYYRDNLAKCCEVKNNILCLLWGDNLSLEWDSPYVRNGTLLKSIFRINLTLT